MAQWNNPHIYNNQYQGGNIWNGDMSNQYSNQEFYSNRDNPTLQDQNQYVNFNQFVAQMANTNLSTTNLTEYNNTHNQMYPTDQFNYPNGPSTSQNVRYTGYNYRANMNIQNEPESGQSAQNSFNAQAQNLCSNDIIKKSNLTPTATEFVPKNSKVYPSSSRQEQESETSNTNSHPATEVRSKPRSSSDTNWRERPQSSHNNDHRTTSENHKSKEPGRHRDTGYRSYDSSSRYDSTNRNQDGHHNHTYENSNRTYDSHQDSSSNQSYDRRGQSKMKLKNKDDFRTFYNSSHKDVKEPIGRNSRGEGSGRGRNWAGTQRLKVDYISAEDEQYASSYALTKEEYPEAKVENNPSQIRQRNKNNQQANKEMTQRERLSEQLDKGTLECLVCCERVKQIDLVWSCTNCYHVFHLKCIRKWAMSSMMENKWRCPACQNTSSVIPSEYRCMCGAVRSPEYQRGVTGAHTCGKSCKRVRSCPHPCTLLCHPGPCPPCQATVIKDCGCGAESRSVLCSSKLPQVCGRVCKRMLQCGVHKCSSECHEGPCNECTEFVTQVCYCPAGKSRSVPCTMETGMSPSWSCDRECGRVLACGAHVCRRACHPPPCPPCRLLPTTVLTCPCGNTRIKEGQRKSCTDPILLCGNICAKPLTCGPVGDKHFCKEQCHEGNCPVCPDNTVVQCRCGHSNREVACSELPELYNNVFCQKKCNKKLSCGRHRCRTVCCSASSHRCAVVCGRTLTCQTHRCEDFCHTGHCAPCPRLNFEELTCECGAEVILPPIRCGTKPPACTAPCRRERPCGHEPHHSCHSGDCPPCVVLTTKRCHGNHEERKTIPCSQEEFSCGLPCGKPLPCGKHTCIKICHKGPCDTGKCTQPCREKRPSCGHECAAPCHSSSDAGGDACPSAAPCRKPVRATCPCGRRAAERACCDNARDHARIMSAMAASKMQEGGSVDLSDVQRPGNMLKTLECDEECRLEARNRQLALALQIRNPDVSSKLAPRYSDHVRATAAREPAFAQNTHDKLTELVQLAKKSKQKTRSHSFPSMNWQKRQFIHELCEHFGCESMAYDAEPNRNVVATADREKSWLPAMSVLEVLAREAGKRRVPGPVLRPPTTTAAVGKPTGGWATLTSTNAWAARTQAKSQSQQTKSAPKIDYFDNPPEN